MDLNTIAEVVQPRQRDDVPSWSSGDALLAGGTWLFSEPQNHLKRLIDLTALGWTPIEADDRGLHIAATCTVAKLHEFPLPAAWIAAPIVGQCCRAFLASFKIWNTATVGGNICMSLPAGPMISLATALHGVATIWADGGERRMQVAEFVTGAKQNVLRPGEILRQIDIPISMLTRRMAFRQLSLTPLGRSAALLIGTLSPQDGAFELTITASTVRPIRLSFPKLPETDALKRRIAAEISDGLFYDDVHGAQAWRKHVTPLLAEDIRNELAGEASS